MNDVIACMPRSIPAGDRVEAAKTATEINPLNQPAMEDLRLLMADVEPTPEFLAVMTTKYWGIDGVRLSVGFLDGPEPELRRKILSHLNAWGETANVRFVATETADQGHVRIFRERTGDPNWDGYWSYVGTDILVAAGPNNQTMNLQEFTLHTPDSEFHRVVRHEAGHTLGFPHEHMRKELVERIDIEKAVAYYREHVGWNRQTTIQQVLTPIESGSIRATAFADPNSIMCYQVPGSITKDGEPIPGGLDFSELDQQFAARIYPKANP